MDAAAEPDLGSRTTPVQRRSQARVDALLDAAAEIVELAGIAMMTTSAIAERSGSSVGVVYRYFPNADAVLVALAERNRDRYLTALVEEFEARSPGDWRAFAGLCIDVYAQSARTIPAFPVIRFGDVVAMRFTNRKSANNEGLGRELVALLVGRYGFQETDELFFATEVAMECADAVTRRAFLHNRDGEEQFIEAAKEIIITIFAPHSPDAFAPQLPAVASNA